MNDGASLAAVLAASSPLITASYDGSDLHLETEATGEIVLSEFLLTRDPPVHSQVQITGVTDPLAAVANFFALSVDGSPIDASGLVFGTLTTTATSSPPP